MYENPQRPTLDYGHRRLFAPVAYPVVRLTQVVPIVHGEALALARWFPVVWRDRGQGPELVVLRALLADDKAQPGGSPRATGSLPLVLRAYPFLLPADAVFGPDDPLNVQFDDAMPDEPTDIGASLLTPVGKPTRATESRLRFLTGFASQLVLTREIGACLAELGLLEPWDFKVTVAGQVLEAPALLILRRDAEAVAVLRAMIDRFGAPGFMLAGAHRISVFRAGALVKAAERALTAAAPQPGSMAS